MKQIKGMQLGAMLAAMLLLSMAFVPAVSAKVANGQQNWSDPTTIKEIIDKLSKAGDKAGKLFASLPPEAQAAVLENLKVAKVTSNVIEVNKAGSGVSAQNNGSYIWEKAGYSLLGIKLWSYFQEINFGYDGTYIISNSRNRYGEVYAPLWSFIGNTGSYEQGGVGYTSYRSWTQGQFKLCAGQYGCVDEGDPWLDMTVYGNGQHSGSQGG